MKVVEKTALVILAILVAWFCLSWCDVLMHNGYQGDRAYSKYNLFIVTYNIVKGI